MPPAPAVQGGRGGLCPQPGDPSPLPQGHHPAVQGDPAAEAAGQRRPGRSCGQQGRVPAWALGGHKGSSASSALTHPPTGDQACCPSCSGSRQERHGPPLLQHTAGPGGSSGAARPGWRAPGGVGTRTHICAPCPWLRRLLGPAGRAGARPGAAVHCLCGLPLDRAEPWHPEGRPASPLAPAPLATRVVDTVLRPPGRPRWVGLTAAPSRSLGTFLQRHGPEGCGQGKRSPSGASGRKLQGPVPAVGSKGPGIAGLELMVISTSQRNK